MKTRWEIRRGLLGLGWVWWRSYHGAAPKMMGPVHGHAWTRRVRRFEVVPDAAP